MLVAEQPGRPPKLMPNAKRVATPRVCPDKGHVLVWAVETPYGTWLWFRGDPARGWQAGWLDEQPETIYTWCRCGRGVWTFDRDSLGVPRRDGTEVL